jgi:3-methyladenine DNA glycosylase AlkD
MKFIEIKELQHSLEKKADTKTKNWWEKYLKHATPFRGVKMAEIRISLHKWFKDSEINEKYDKLQQIDICLEFISQKHSEDKLAGILFLQEILIPGNGLKPARDLPKFVQLFENEHINDWNICDWFCLKVLGPIVKKYGKQSALIISEWKTANTIWQRRASVVAFVNLAKQGEGNFEGFIELILENSLIIKDQERFIQTGTGWVLRELSIANKKEVINFIKENLQHFTPEGLQYASKYLLDKEKKNLKEKHKGLFKKFI